MVVFFVVVLMLWCFCGDKCWEKKVIDKCWRRLLEESVVEECCRESVGRRE